MQVTVFSGLDALTLLAPPSLPLFLHALEEKGME